MLIDLPIEIITLEDSSYHLMIEAQFPNQTCGNFIIDTGASKTVFDTAFVQPFIIDRQQVDQQTTSGINAMINEAHTGKIPFMQLGNFEIKNLEIVVLDLSHINELYRQYSQKTIAGLIGSDFLLKHDAVIDYNQAKLTLNF